MSNIYSKFQNKFRNASISGFFVILLMTGIFHADSVMASEITPDSVIKLVNESRKEAKIEPLKNNNLLQKAAEEKAQDMIDRDYFAHTSPQGLTPWDFITQAGYDYRYAGENLAINYTDPKDQQQAWMDSPLHRKNILSPDYQEIGVAVKSGFVEGHQTIVTVQEFGSQMPKVAIKNVAGVEVQNKISYQNSSANTFNKIIPTVSATILVENKTRDRIPENSGNALLSGVLQQIESGNFFYNSRLTLAGWVMLFVFSLIVTLTDMFLISREKYKNCFSNLNHP